MTAYARLAARFARIATIGEASGMLDWDAAGDDAGRRRRGARRPARRAGRAGARHADATRPSRTTWPRPKPARPRATWEAANLRLMRHAYTRATALPADLVEAQARANSGLREGLARGAAQSDFAHGRARSGRGRRA